MFDFFSKPQKSTKIMPMFKFLEVKPSLGKDVKKTAKFTGKVISKSYWKLNDIRVNQIERKEHKRIQAVKLEKKAKVQEAKKAKQAKTQQAIENRRNLLK